MGAPREIGEEKSVGWVSSHILAHLSTRHLLPEAPASVHTRKQAFGRTRSGEENLVETGLFFSSLYNFQ